MGPLVQLMPDLRARHRSARRDDAIQIVLQKPARSPPSIRAPCPGAETGVTVGIRRRRPAGRCVAPGSKAALVAPAHLVAVETVEAVHPGRLDDGHGAREGFATCVGRASVPAPRRGCLYQTSNLSGAHPSLLAMSRTAVVSLASLSMWSMTAA